MSPTRCHRTDRAIMEDLRGSKVCLPRPSRGTIPQLAMAVEPNREDSTLICPQQQVMVPGRNVHHLLPCSHPSDGLRQPAWKLSADVLGSAQLAVAVEAEVFQRAHSRVPCSGSIRAAATCDGSRPVLVEPNGA
eukprot:752110-Hanusia_phi.AAC.5